MRDSEMLSSPNLFVMLKILSSEYQLYACGKIFRMPRFWTKIFLLQEARVIEKSNYNGLWVIVAITRRFC